MNCAVVIGREEDTGAGWAFEVMVCSDSEERDHRALMSWVDYDYWCGGSVAPAEVVRIAIEAGLRSINADALPSVFDLSTLRRRCIEFDDIVRARLGRPATANTDEWADDNERRTRSAG